MYNWYEAITLYYKYYKINDTTIVISDIYAAKKRKLSAKLLNRDKIKNDGHLHFRNVDLWRHFAMYSLPVYSIHGRPISVNYNSNGNINC